jgi:predicted transcriptional regulator
MLAAQAAGWESWCVFVQRARKNEEALKKFIGRILRLKEAMGWVAWVHFVLAERESDRLGNARSACIRRVAANIMSSLSARALRHWREATRAIAAATALARAVAEERVIMAAMVADSVSEARHARQAEAQATLKRIMRAFGASTLRKSWHTWRQHELAYARVRTTLLSTRKAFGRIIVVAQAAAWDSWCVFVQRARKNEKAVKKLLGRILRLKEAMGWVAWNRFVSTDRESSRLAKARLVAIRRVAANLLFSTSARALRHLREVTRAIAAATALARAVAEERAIMAAMMADSESGARQAEAQAALKRVLRAFASSTLRKGWHTWRQQELAHARGRTLLLRAQKTIGRLVLAAQAAAWDSWWVFVKRARENEKAVKKLLGRILRLKEAMGWVAWNRFVLADRESKQMIKARSVALRRVAANLLFSISARALRRWRDVAKAVGVHVTLFEHRAELAGSKALVAELESHVEEARKAHAEIHETHLVQKATEREKLIEAAKAYHGEGRRKRS